MKCGLYRNQILCERLAANVCRSNCCKQFHDVVKETPNSYLKHYRIMKSCQLLRDTNRSRDIPTDKKPDILNALEQIGFIPVYKANNKKFMIKRMNGGALYVYW